MNGHRSPLSESRGPARRLRLAALIVVVIGVLALAAAAFALSYSGVRATALSSGVAPRLARIYPMIFDGVLVVGCAAAISLQAARWWLRSYAWLSVLVVIGTVATADTVHAMAVRVPKHPIEAAGAIVPWAVLLIGFTLLYAMARQASPRRKAGQAPAGGLAPVTAEPVTVQPVTAEPVTAEPMADAPQPPGSEAAGPESAAAEDPPGTQAVRAAVEGPATQETTVAEPDVTAGYLVPASTATLSELLGRRAETSPYDPAANPLSDRHGSERDEPSDADAEPAPHFSRMRSSPTPPQGEPWIVEASDG